MKLILVTLSLLISFSYASICPENPKLWCNTRHIAAACGVTDQCSRYSSADSTVDPVVVEVHYESYCPDSRNFITGELINTWAALNETGIMEVKLVPYGKAVTIDDTEHQYKFFCQHGQKECLGNRIQNCAIRYLYHDFLYIPSIACMMQNGEDHNTIAPKCTGSMWSYVNDCADESGEGHVLLKEAGDLKQALDPALNWVPWILINGLHTDDIQKAATSNLLSLVCETYKGLGGTLPDECN